MTSDHSTRPGRTEAGPLATLAFLAVLFVSGAAGWAAFFGVVWLVWAYTLVSLIVVASLAIVAGCAYLAVKGNRRGQAVAAAVFGLLVMLVIWTATQ